MDDELTTSPPPSPPSTNNQPEIEKKIAVARLLKLLDIKLPLTDSTNIFSGEIHQKGLIDAVQYWFDQTKMFFGEPVAITQQHSMAEAGIDILIELMISKVKFGIQIKTPGDIKEKDFMKNVKAQIFDSRKHRLSRMIIALAGDLNDKSHSQKIGVLNSEISQTDYPDVIVLQPQKMVTIYDTFVKNVHPMKHLLLEQQTAGILLKGIVEGLSNEERTVTANIEIKYHNEINKSDPVKTITLKTDDPRLLDDIEKLHYTGELMKFDDRLKDFSVKSNNGTEEVRLRGEGSNSSSSDEASLYAFSPRDDRVPIAIQIVDEQDKMIKSLGLQLFTVKREGKVTQLEIHDSDQPLRVTFTISEGEPTKSRISIDPERGDVVRLFEALDFLRATDPPSRRLKLYLANINRYVREPLPPRPEHKESYQELYNFVCSLSIIQKYTNEPMSLPKTSVPLETIKQVSEIATIIEKGKPENARIPLSLPKSDAIRLITDYIGGNIDKDAPTMEVNLRYRIFDKEISIRPVIELSKFKPKGNLEELKKKLEAQNEDTVQIELEPIA